MEKCSVGDSNPRAGTQRNKDELDALPARIWSIGMRKIYKRKVKAHQKYGFTRTPPKESSKVHAAALTVIRLDGSRKESVQGQ